MEYGWPCLPGFRLSVTYWPSPGILQIKPYASAIYMLIGRFARFLLWTWLYLQYGERFF